LRASGDPNVGVLGLQGGFLVAGVVAPIRGVHGVRVGDTQVFSMVGPRCWNGGTSTLRTSGDPSVGLMALLGGFLNVGEVGPHCECLGVVHPDVQGGGTQMFK